MILFSPGWIQRMDTSMGLTSVASLSLNLSMSMSGGMGAFTNMARSNPILSRRGSKEKLDGTASGHHTPAAGRSPALSRSDGRPNAINHVRASGSNSGDHSPSLRYNKAMARVEEEKSSDVSSESDPSASIAPGTTSNNFQTEARIEHNALVVPPPVSNRRLPLNNKSLSSTDPSIIVTDDQGKQPTVTFLLENEVIPSPEDESNREQQRLLLDLTSPTNNHNSRPTPPSTPTSPSTVISLVSPTMSNGPMATSDSLIDLESRAASSVASSPDSIGDASTPTGMLLEVRGSSSSSGADGRHYATASF